MQRPAARPAHRPLPLVPATPTFWGVKIAWIATSTLALAACASHAHHDTLHTTVNNPYESHRPVKDLPWYFRRGSDVGNCGPMVAEPRVAPADRVRLRLHDLEGLAIARRDRGVHQSTVSLYETAAEVAELLHFWPELAPEARAMATVARQIDDAGEAEMDPLIGRLLQLCDVVGKRLRLSNPVAAAPPPHDAAPTKTSLERTGSPSLPQSPAGCRSGTPPETPRP